MFLTNKSVRKNRWTNGDIVFIAIIFYLLGILTALLFCSLIASGNTKHTFPFTHWFIPSSSNDNHPLILQEDKTSNQVQNIQTSSLSQNDLYYLWETTTVIRSALYQYVKNYNQMPKDLSVLQQPSPNNFVTALPKDPLLYSNRVYETYTGTGGWVYQPQEINNQEDLIDVIQNSIIPNIEGIKLEIPFRPLEVKIIKDQHQLWVVSGNVIIRRYPIGLGKNDRTPTGTFQIVKKIMNPNQHQYSLEQSPYGKRGLELSNSNYAIHGTNQTKSIGKNISNGCIRMLNDDIVELYSLIPLYTTVDIQMKAPSSSDYKDKEPHHLLPFYSQKDQLKEEDHNQVYKWLH